jgi:hypothetical protein
MKFLEEYKQKFSKQELGIYFKEFFKDVKELEKFIKKYFNQVKERVSHNMKPVYVNNYPLRRNDVI